jgi:hypothetical protein
MDAGLDRLQDILLRMSPGDELSVEQAAELSGMDRETCEFVLDALKQVGLMVEQRDDSYIRCRLTQTPV